MNIEYIRHLNASHMVTAMEKELTQWESSMVEHNQISGVLFAKQVSVNQTCQLWFDITGKQALDTLLEDGRLDYGLLCRLLIKLLEITNRLERLLLSPDHLWLLPNTIFVDSRNEMIYFCYYPGYDRKLYRSFAELAEYLLTRVDHKDDKAVELMYALYENTRQEGYGLMELLQDVRVVYNREEEPVQEKEYPPQQKQTVEICPKETTEKQTKNGGHKYGEDIQAFWQGVCNRVKRYFGGDTRKTQLRKAAKRNRTKKEEVFVFLPDEEKEDRNIHPTVLLSDIPQKVEGVLRYEGEGEQADLVLDRFPYVIGSDKSCNGYLPGEAVSRRHARVTRQEEIYFIEDLNSSNGTYVDGELLNYRVRMSLKKMGRLCLQIKSLDLFKKYIMKSVCNLHRFSL